MPKHKIIAICVLALGLAGSANAGVVWSAPPNQTGGSDLNGFLEGDDFVIGSESIIFQVAYWALQSVPADYSGSTDWAFYSNGAGVPGAILFSGNAVATGVSTGNTTLGLNEFKYTFGVPNIDLLPGTYWLVLHNGPSGVDPGTTYDWAWNSDSGNSQSKDITAPSDPWVGNLSELAFEITAIPEPASMTLIGAGLLATWFVRRKLNTKR